MLMIVSIVPIVLLAVIVLIVFIIMGLKMDKTESEGEDVIKKVYVYIVLFATLMMTIGGSVSAFMAAADIIAPAPYYQTFEEYKKWNTVDKPAVEKNGTETEEPILSEEELIENYNAMVSAEKERHINRAKNNLIKSFGWIIIPLPIFIYFQRRLKNKEE
jgi:Ca2+/Na+ antiporter